MPVHVQHEQGIVTCTLDNPGRLNALTSDMLATLIDTLNSAHTDDTLRAIVIRGAGGNFCSGRDLRELDVQGAARPSPEAAIAPVTELAQAVLDCPAPTLAVIEGKAVGLGVAIASWCDMVVASGSSLFSIPEARAGVLPTFTAVSLARTLGQRRALALCLTGRALSAEQALAFGLAHFVFPESSFEDDVQGLLQDFRKGGPQAQRGCKALLEQAVGQPFKAALGLAAQASIQAMGSAESQEGMSAFKEKRLPTWYGQGN